jgi:hypothetical protein
MKVVKVIPEYGFGWQNEHQSINVPSPFNVHDDVYEKVAERDVYRLIIGSVAEPGHMFDKLWVLLAVRTVDSPATYNILVYPENPPFYRGDNIDPFCVPRVASGFATLEI